MKKNLLLVGIFFALLSVLAGAFGSHALREIFSQENLATYETAVRYQMYHSLAILFTALFITGDNNKYSTAAGLLFVSGIIFFCGSLYATTFLKSQSISVPAPLALATPLGGILFACGWVVLAVSILKNKI